MRPSRRTLMVASLVGAALFAPWQAVEGQPEGGAPARAVLEVTPVRASIGDALAATLVVEAPAGQPLDPPALEARFGSLSVLSGAWGPAETIGERTRWTWNGTLAAYTTGEVEIPAIAIDLPGTPPATLRTEPLTVTIESILPPATEGADPGTAEPEVADLKPPVSVAPEYGPLRRALLVLAALLVAAALGWWLHRRYAGRLAAVAAPEDPFRRVPPHQWAYEELKRLLERRLPEAGRTEEFFEALARILKRYLGGRFRIELLEQTTEEVLPQLEQAGAPAPAVAELGELLALADLVKFARRTADPEACRAAMEEAYRIVDATKPPEPAATASAAANPS